MERRAVALVREVLVNEVARRRARGATPLAAKVLLAIEDEFRARVSKMPESVRREFSEAVVAFAVEVMAVDLARALALQDLADAIWSPPPASR